MEKLFIPGIKLINRLKYPQKFSLISVLLVLFISALLIIIVYELEQKISYYEKERSGLVYIDPIKDFFQAVEEHRGLTNAYLNGDKSKNIIKGINETEIAIAKEIAEINKINQARNDVFNISKKWNEITTDWNNLKEIETKLKPEENFQKHSSIIEKILNLIIDISDRSNLSLGSGLDTFYLAHSISINIPVLTNEIGKLRGLGVGISVKKQLTNSERKKIFIYKAFIQSALTSINDSSERVFNENESLNERLRSFLLDINVTTQTFLEYTRKNIIDAKTIKISPQKFFENGTIPIRSSFRLYETEMVLLDDLIQEEINKYEQIRFWVIFPAFIVLLGLVYIFTCFTLSVVNAIKYLQEKALKVAEGDLNVEAELKTGDELKNLSDSLNKMIYGLRTFVKREEITRSIVIGALESENIKDTLWAIVLNTAKLFDVNRCLFIEYDVKNDVFLPIDKNASFISSPEFFDPVGMRLSKEEMQPYSDIIFRQKRALAVENVDILNIPESSRQLLETCGCKSFMMAPIIYTGIPAGILILATEKGGRLFTEEEVQLLESITNQLSIVIHQAKLMEQIKEKGAELESALEIEKILRKITAEAILFTTHEEVDNYLLNQLINIFNIDKAVHLHVGVNSLNWYIRYKKHEKIEISRRECCISEESTRELIPKPEEILIYENVEKEVKNEQLKNCLKKEKINSFMAYPTSKKFSGREEKDVVEVTLIANSEPKSWTHQEITLFKIIMDTLSIVTLETIQRQELEEVRKIFITTLTHDLKSPIIAEQKAIEFLLSPRAKEEGTNCSIYLNEIYKTNEDLLKLINNLLSVYQYESGEWKLNKKSVNIEALIREVSQSLKYLIKDREAEISFDIPKDLPFPDVDIIEIKRVISNLISNAIKHNRKGVKIFISVLKTNNFIRVSIKDNGTGISSEIKSKIFRRYMTQKGEIGSGLGLYISKQIVEAHDGKIWFETEEEKGTTFYFTLPLE